MRVLLAAFACQPHRGSEPGAGWIVAREAALAGHEVVLVTQRRHRPAIEAERAGRPELAEHLRPVYIGLPAGVLEAWDRRLHLRGLQLYNLVWQLSLWRAARRIHRRQPVDVAHHLTLSTDWVPTGLALVPGLPFVWGPLGGSERVPASCRRWLGRRGTRTERLRRVTADPLRRLLALPAARRARLLVAQNPLVAAQFERAGPPVVVRPHVFLDPADWPAEVDLAAPPRRPADEPGPRRAVFAGRLLGWKGVYLALAVLARPELGHWSLDVYGAGPERADLEAEVGRRGLTGRVVLHGQRPRTEVLGAMAAADAFFFPTMREAAGWVVAEALLVGCPVVCLDHGGPAVLLGDGGGIAVAPGDEVVGGLAKALLDSPGVARATTAWDTAPLPGLLADWYGQATTDPAPPVTVRPTGTADRGEAGDR
ncbi:MAG TPA: glycosyltransferase [Acidimicrobiales bacterium]|nr:glycosyltransferase [Acidimicrobiales bacterium]